MLDYSYGDSSGRWSFIGVTLITYVLFFLLPADPARLAAGKSATAEDVAASSTSSASTARSTSSTPCSSSGSSSTTRSAARTRTGAR